MYVLKHTDMSSTFTLGGYIAAALLNAQKGLTPVLSVSTVRAMWNAWVAGLPYQPAPGVNWGNAEIIAYIKTTMA
jgi:hypothetical protein